MNRGFTREKVYLFINKHMKRHISNQENTDEYSNDRTFQHWMDILLKTDNIHLQQKEKCSTLPCCRYDCKLAQLWEGRLFNCSHPKVLKFVCPLMTVLPSAHSQECCQGGESETAQNLVLVTKPMSQLPRTYAMTSHDDQLQVLTEKVCQRV